MKIKRVDIVGELELPGSRDRGGRQRFVAEVPAGSPMASTRIAIVGDYVALWADASDDAVLLPRERVQKLIVDKAELLRHLDGRDAGGGANAAQKGK